MIIVNADMVRTILGSLTQNSPYVRVDPMPGVPFPAKIVQLNTDSIAVNLDFNNLTQIVSTKELRVIFNIGDHKLQCTTQFISNAMPTANGGVECNFGFPIELHHKDARDYMRIAIPKEDDLKASFVLNGSSLPVEVLDASPCGVRISNRRLELSNYVEGAKGKLDVPLYGSNQPISLESVIMWKNGTTVGLLFPEKKSTDLRDPNDQWLNTLRRLIERSVLRNR